MTYKQEGDLEFHKEFDQSCGTKDFCSRFAQLLGRDHKEHANHMMTAYYVEPDSLVVHEDAIHAILHLHEHEYYSNQVEKEKREPHLDLHIALFQEGIMQVKIKASSEEERFAISNTGIGIDWDQIKVQQHLHDFVKILDDGILISGQDKVSYKIQFDPFRIIQYVDGHETIIVNDNDNLFYDLQKVHPKETHHEEEHHEYETEYHHANQVVPKPTPAVAP